MRILIVDDEVCEIETLRRGLRIKGHQVVGALGGREALAADLGEIDMVITDYVMPNMNGMELAQIIRKNHRLPVILMSPYGRLAVPIEAVQSSCDGFIEKPFTLEGLVDEIDRVRAKTSL